jgi:hypothetical protein
MPGLTRALLESDASYFVAAFHRHELPTEPCP